MPPLSAWLPARSNQDSDLVVKLVGRSITGLVEEFGAVGQILTDQGLEVMTETGRLHGESGESTFRVRLAASPFYSMGHGFNILVYLGDQTPFLQEFGLQRGSVVVWEPPEERRLQPALPEGVIAYPVPLKSLAAENDDGMAARGFVAMGVLFHLLGFPEWSLRMQRASLMARRSVEAGFRFAKRALAKRDIYALPLAEPIRRRILLNPHRSVMLGLAAGHCKCAASCDEEMKRSPMAWVTEHVAIADRMVSLLRSNRHPGACVYRGPRGDEFAFLGGNDSAIRSYVKRYSNPRIFAAADVPDALQLLVRGHRLIRNGFADVIGVVIEDGLASRYQSVEVDLLAEAIRPPKTAAGDRMPDRPQAGNMTVEYDGTYDADVGYVAWGSAQGVVRDAMSLCRGFGLNVAALYPKAVLPFPENELASFARTVKRVVLVESSQTGGLSDRVRASCPFDMPVIRPEPGRSLTPMDIFLREGLGAC